MANSLRIDAQLNNLSTIRGFVEETAIRLKAAPDVVFGVVLAVDEMVTNIIVHGYQGQPGTIEIDLAASGDALRIQLRDHAPPFDPTTVPPPDLSVPFDERSAGGLGVYIARKIMDDMTHQVMDHNGNEVILIKHHIVKEEGAMNFVVDYAQGKVPVTILAPEGDVDGSNYQALIARAQELYASGTRYLLLDLQQVPYMSSAGIVALHGINKLLKGEAPPDPEGGWEAIHSVEREQPGSKHTQLKLLNPQPRVDRLLDMAGLTEFFEIYSDRAAAVASY